MKFLIWFILLLLVIGCGLSETPTHQEMTGWTTLQPNWQHVQDYKSMMKEGWRPDGYYVLGDSLVLMWRKP
jgi:hypothetical protein